MRKELLHKRTVDTKLFDLGNNQFELVKSPLPLHYKVNNKLVDIDTNFKRKRKYFEIVDAPYNGIVFRDKIKYQFTAKDGGRVDVELREIGGIDILNLPIKINLVQDKVFKNKLIYKDVLPGLDIIVAANPYKFEAYKILEDDTVPKSFKWDVFQDKKTNAKFITKTVGKDSADNEIHLLNNHSLSNFTTKTNNLLDKIVFEEEFTNKVKIRDKKTRIKKLSTKVQYPIIIDASVSIAISTDADDGYEALSASGFMGWYFNSTSVKISAINTLKYYGGFRFQNVTVPQGATINSASLVWFVKNNAGGANIKIYGDNIDTATVWGSASMPSQIAKTTAFGSFSPTAAIGATTNAPITTPLQEIINRAGWLSGNNIRFGAFPTISGKQFKVADFGDTVNPPASLSITYTTSSTTSPIVSTSNMKNLKLTTAMGVGDIQGDGGASVSERGFVWATTTAPTTSNSKLIVSGTVGLFTGTLTGLTTNTVYYVRAYGINTNGTAYGNEIKFRAGLINSNFASFFRLNN